ncbi:DgyrCDS12303 [Dimorphilus gyrociliatus]|uniref:DgyrCDS12303 n=1 Tax=Dimorphilus gyrociliatus TaxID=2664684 RepID=A0A7I8W628_9ANNE|nr:DgyrCDS12303 [Dimorphilus gyrociliatus]
MACSVLPSIRKTKGSVSNKRFNNSQEKARPLTGFSVNSGITFKSTENRLSKTTLPDLVNLTRNFSERDVERNTKPTTNTIHWNDNFNGWVDEGENKVQASYVSFVNNAQITERSSKEHLEDKNLKPSRLASAPSVKKPLEARFGESAFRNTPGCNKTDNRSNLAPRVPYAKKTDKTIKKSKNSNTKLDEKSGFNNSNKNNATKPVKSTSKNDQQTIEKEVETQQTRDDELTFIVPGFQDESDVKVKREAGNQRNQTRGNCGSFKFAAEKSKTKGKKLAKRVKKPKIPGAQLIDKKKVACKEDKPENDDVESGYGEDNDADNFDDLLIERSCDQTNTSPAPQSVIDAESSVLLEQSNSRELYEPSNKLKAIEETSKRIGKRKNRWRATFQSKTTDIVEESGLPKPPAFNRKVRDWIFSDDEDEITITPTATSPKTPTPVPDTIENPFTPRKEETPSPVETLPKLVTPPPQKSKPVAKNSKEFVKKKEETRDKSWQEELERNKRAEERRRKALNMIEGLKSRKKVITKQTEMEKFENAKEDFDWLSQYCIFQDGHMDMYERAFNIIDENKLGWLDSENTMIAIKACNTKLTDMEEKYLLQILDTTGYDFSKGSDFKIFSIIAALSHRIKKLDDWVLNYCGNISFRLTNMKVHLCRQLWELNVDPGTNSISLETLCIHLRAGGVCDDRISYVKKKLSHLSSLSLLDFLIYSPLFITLHENMVNDPLSDARKV